MSASSPRGIGYGKTMSSWISPRVRALEKLETRVAVSGMARHYLALEPGFAG